MAEDADDGNAADESAALVGYQDDAAKRLSDKVRGLCLGVVGFAWVLISSDKGLGKTIATRHELWIVVVAALAVMALGADLLHSAMYQWIVQRKLKRYRAGAEYSGILYRSQTWLLWFKILICLVACAGVLAVVAKGLLFEI